MPKNHEQSDAKVKPMMVIAASSIFFMVFMFYIFAQMFSIIKTTIIENTPNVAPESLIKARESHQEPLLEVKPEPINKAHILKERQLLDSYGWIDQNKSIARIPINKAIEIFLYEQ